jgi:DedD protein
VEESLKRRLIGATVLVSLVVIFVPMLLEQEPVVSPSIDETNIPPPPETEFSSRVLPLESETLDSLPAEAGTEGEQAGEEPEQPAQPEAEPEAQPETASATTQPGADSPDLRVGLSAWVVQAGSFSKRDNADKVVQDLQKKKFPAFVEKTELKGQTLYRVLIGPEVDHKRAEAMAEKLQPELQRWKLTGKLRSYP